MKNIVKDNETIPKNDSPQSNNTKLLRDNPVTNLLLAAHAMTELHSGNTPPQSPMTMNGTNYIESDAFKARNVLLSNKLQSTRSPKRKPFINSNNNVISTPKSVTRRSSGGTSSSAELSSENDENATTTSPTSTQSQTYQNQTSQNNETSNINGSFLLISPNSDPRRIKRSRIGSLKKSTPRDNQQLVDHATKHFELAQDRSYINGSHMSPKRASPSYITAAKARIDAYMATPVTQQCPNSGEILTPVSARLIDFSRKIDMNSEVRQHNLNLELEENVSRHDNDTTHGMRSPTGNITH